MSRHRNWVFTLPNPTTSDIIDTCQVKLLVATLEEGEGGLLHYQGYLELTNSRNLSQVRSFFGESNPHLEPRRGTKSQALSYVLKDWPEELKNSTESVDICASQVCSGSSEPLPWILSGLKPVIICGFSGSYLQLTQSVQVKTTVRQRLQAVKELIQSGSSLSQVAEADFELFCKYNRAFHAYEFMQAKNRSQMTDIILILGPTGTGKSRLASEWSGTKYWKPRGQWWTGYNNEETVILDDFYGWMPYDDLLRLGDRYPLILETKGGHVNFNSKTVIITSNKPPELWYERQHNLEALYRRIKQWIIIPTLGEKHEYEARPLNLGFHYA